MSHIDGYTKRDGTFVTAHDNKVVKKPEQKPAGKPFLGHHFQAPPKPKEPPEGFHPQANDDGKQVPIYKLSAATRAGTWHNQGDIATVTPHESKTLPDALHGVKFTPWRDAPESLQDWAEVDGQNLEDEPDFEPAKGMKTGSGVVIEEDDGRIWVVHPTNAFGGYQATFPKGTLEEGLPLQASAIKEAYEESGLKVEITGFLGDIKRTTSVARYYTARRVGGTPAAMGWESQAVSLVPKEQLKDVLNQVVDHDLADLILGK